MSEKWEREFNSYIELAVFKKGDTFRDLHLGKKYKCHVIDVIRDHQNTGYVDLIIFKYYGVNKHRWYYQVEERWLMGMRIQNGSINTGA